MKGLPWSLPPAPAFWLTRIQVWNYGWCQWTVLHGEEPCPLPPCARGWEQGTCGLAVTLDVVAGLYDTHTHCVSEGQLKAQGKGEAPYWAQPPRPIREATGMGGGGGCPSGSRAVAWLSGAPTDSGCEGTPLPLAGAGNSRHHHSHSQSLHVNSYFPCKSKRTF